ncbi:hypothetical protein SGUI_0989 [Serinicoccus hydrothermalis]|uniref:Uncharacterized protein n=1 Tax=Serinicoccus hydrothermalis TaxID=1758689 RepID=A0A1B1NAH9_9MICO|nr:hypothetical protein [Serinicoccus hydrothermalis]ANS78385.1 hypothetical protein SGUI_0989 [Serinicoccus hydrothermalis]
MSDLQCPARILLLPEGLDHVTRLVPERILHVYGSSGAAAGGAADLLASTLGVGSTRLTVAGPSPVHGDAADLLAVLDDLADLHRGETVVVVGQGNAIAAALASLGRPDLAADLSPTAGIALERDGDGWRHTGTV